MSNWQLLGSKCLSLKGRAWEEMTIRGTTGDLPAARRTMVSACLEARDLLIRVSLMVRGEWTIGDLRSARQLLVYGALCVCIFEHER